MINPFLNNYIPRNNYYNITKKPIPNKRNPYFIEATKKNTSKKNTFIPLLEISNFKLCSDDIIILALIYFLYKQNTDDKLLILTLFALLF